MAGLLFWVALAGLILTPGGIVLANTATTPPLGYLGTILAGIGVLMLAFHAVCSLAVA